ncbi:hypothetical protein [Streptomyces sp. AJS327]|nr:hypothetical protein [Streptomyces sp. AJS327]
MTDTRSQGRGIQRTASARAGALVRHSRPVTAIGRRRTIGGYTASQATS